jgi:D-alanyl-D-alanine carboxypeptidase (penicillin-binding protein 5/6)
MTRPMTSGSRRRQSFGFENARRRRARRRRRRALLVLVVLLVVVAIGSARLEVQSPPHLRLTRVLTTSAVFPGPAPKVVWPTQGEAAVEVTGVGALHSPGPSAPEAIASVTKIMTAYVLLRDHPLAVGAKGFNVVINATDVADEDEREAQNQSVIGVTDGEVLDEYQLLQALLVASANNIAPIVATYDAGSQGGFVAKMNATARALGMVHTTYTDPSGFNQSTVSTASDQLLLAQAAVQEPVLDQIADLPTVSLPEVGTINNFDSLLDHDGFVGIKTGSDSDAGGCFVFDDHRVVDGRSVTVLGVVLGQDQGVVGTKTLLGAVLGAATALADSVVADLAVRTVVPTGTPVVGVAHPHGPHVWGPTTTALSALGWGTQRVPLSLALRPATTQMKVGQPVAVVTISGLHAEASSAVATASMPPLTLGWRLRHTL